MSDLFGFSIKRKKEQQQNAISPVPPNNDDGSSIAAFGGHYGYYLDLEGKFRTDFELIRKYREMSLHPECDYIIDDIANEAIVSDNNDVPVEIELTNVKVSESLKRKIREEFDYIIGLLDFENKAHNIFRRWYIDGRLFYHKVIDFNNPSNGIVELRYVDPLKIKKIREIKNTNPTNSQENYVFSSEKVSEYFLYNPNGLHDNDKNSIKIAPDAITFVPSGLTDYSRDVILSYLHKAIKVLNQLRMLEDSIVIYRLARSSEKRIFYIDVGNLPKVKAEQYLRDVMLRYRQKMVYDSTTGEMKDSRNFMSMMEDYWLPRRDGSRGTEITTLQGGQNLGNLEDLKYFEKKLYQALNVPASRLEQESSAFNFGTSSQILRDELKFTKFVDRLRKHFSQIFIDLLKTQLILKNIMTIEDWDSIKNHIQFDFLKDNHYTELKDLEIVKSRVDVLTSLEKYIGLYFSNKYIRSKILRQSDGEIIEIDNDIKKERKEGNLPDMDGSEYLKSINGFMDSSMQEPTPSEAIPKESKPEKGIKEPKNPK